MSLARGASQIPLTGYLGTGSYENNAIQPPDRALSVDDLNALFGIPSCMDKIQRIKNFPRKFSLPVSSATWKR